MSGPSRGGGRLASLLQQRRPRGSAATGSKRPAGGASQPSKRARSSPAGGSAARGRQPPQQRQQHGEPVPGKPLAAAGSDDEGGSDAEEEELLPAGPAAHGVLVGLLLRQRRRDAGATAAAAARQPRQNVRSGSDQDDSESEEQPASDEGEREGQTEGEAESEGESEDGEGSEQAAAAHAGAPTANGDEAATKQQPGAASDGPAAPDAPDAADAAGSSSSAWEHFISRELSDAEVAALRSGSHSWREAAPEQQDPTRGLWQRARWQFSGRDGFPAAPSCLADYGVRERLIARWREVQADAERAASHAAASTSGAGGRRGASSGGGSGAGRDGDFASPQQRALFALCDSYADVLYTAKPYPGGPGWAPGQPDEAADALLLHVLNHCAKTADAIKKNNERVKGLDPADVSDVPRDQGFTRPKALILLPMRHMAFRLVTRLVALAQRETRADSVQGKEKFVEQFAGEGDGDGDDAAAAVAPPDQDGQGGGAKTKSVAKPLEHRALFRGNVDDHFRLGIRITRGQIKLGADLLQSDIIVASPVGLATKLAEDSAAAAAAAAPAAGGRRGGRGGGRGGRGGRAGRGDRGSGSSGGGGADFLSSIEVCVLERADVLLMQNWQHVVTVLEALNQLPKQQHAPNIMRVRLHLLASQGALYRQTIMTSSFASPQLNAAFSRLACSHAGRFRVVAQPSGVLAQVVPQVRQLFERFAAPSAAAAPDARFDFFRSAIWPRLSEAGAAGGLLLVVPSYFDYVRLKSFLRAEEAEFACISEYSERREVTRARALFFQRRARLLLYSERGHFYQRHRIRGVQDIIFYGPPEHGHYYAELVNLVQSTGGAAGGHHGTVTTLFCAWDALALARVVGHSRAAKMLADDASPTFVFC